MKIQVGTVLELESISYIIREQIDESGNATVWKAEAPGDSCIYAIKVLNEETSRHNEKLIRFDRECQFCKDTYNMHIVKVFDYVQRKARHIVLCLTILGILEMLLIQKMIHLFY